MKIKTLATVGVFMALLIVYTKAIAVSSTLHTCTSPLLNHVKHIVHVHCFGTLCFRPPYPLALALALAPETTN